MDKYLKKYHGIWKISRNANCHGTNIDRPVQFSSGRIANIHWKYQIRQMITKRRRCHASARTHLRRVIANPILVDNAWRIVIDQHSSMGFGCASNYFSIYINVLRRMQPNWLKCNFLIKCTSNILTFHKTFIISYWKPVNVKI